VVWPNVVQFVASEERFVVPKTVNESPGLSVSSTWNVPFGKTLGFFSTMGVADHTLRPGKIAMEVGELSPDAKTDPVPSVVNFSIVPFPELAT
jgi:hypothetical protein